LPLYAADGCSTLVQLRTLIGGPQLETIRSQASAHDGPSRWYNTTSRIEGFQELMTTDPDPHDNPHVAQSAEDQSGAETGSVETGAGDTAVGGVSLQKQTLRLLGAVLVLALIVAAPFFRDSLEPQAIYVQEPGHEQTGHRYLYDERLGWRNIPNWQATTHGRKLTTNALGMRDRPYSVQKPQGIYRILFLGGSFTWGYGVADDEVFSAVLEERLGDRQQTDGGYEVLNTGVSGWGTDQELLFLMDEGFRFDPDLVVLSFNLTENPLYNVSSVQFGLAKPMYLDTRLKLGNVPVPKPGTDYPQLTCSADQVDLTIAILERMAEKCAEHGCPLVVMKFGAFHYRQHSEFRDSENIQTELTKLESRFHAVLNNDSRIRLLDLDQAFTARGLVLDELLAGNFDGHWNAFGHRQVAVILHQFLKDQKLVGPDRAPVTGAE